MEPAREIAIYNKLQEKWCDQIDTKEAQRKKDYAEHMDYIHRQCMARKTMREREEFVRFLYLSFMVVGMVSTLLVSGGTEDPCVLRDNFDSGSDLKFPGLIGRSNTEGLELSPPEA